MNKIIKEHVTFAKENPYFTTTCAIVGVVLGVLVGRHDFKIRNFFQK